MTTFPAPTFNYVPFPFGWLALSHCLLPTTKPSCIYMHFVLSKVVLLLAFPPTNSPLCPALARLYTLSSFFCTHFRKFWQLFLPVPLKGHGKLVVAHPFCLSTISGAFAPYMARVFSFFVACFVWLPCVPSFYRGNLLSGHPERPRFPFVWPALQSVEVDAPIPFSWQPLFFITG